LQKIQEDLHDASSTIIDKEIPEKLTKDLDLAFEEEHAILNADHRALKKKHADFMTRFEALQMKNEDLHQRNDQLEDKVKALEDANSGDQTDYIKRLLREIEEREALIERQEGEAETSRIVKEQQAQELATLRPAAQRFEEIRDELQMLKNENAALTKKANMMDHFQAKLERQSSIERDNAKLREAVDVLQGNQKAFDQVYSENEQLKKSTFEYSRKFQKYENDIVGIETQKRTLIDDIRNKDAELEALKRKLDHDDEFIKDLQEQIRTGNQAPHSPSSPIARTGPMTLEEELDQTAEPPANDLEVSRLRAEINVLKSSSVGTSNATLRLDLEESESIRKRLEENLQEITEKHALAQEQLHAIISKSSSEKSVKAAETALKFGPLRMLSESFYRDDAIRSTRKQYLDTNEQLTATNRKLAEVQAELSLRDIELLKVKADCKFNVMSR